MSLLEEIDGHTQYMQSMIDRLEQDLNEGCAMFDEKKYNEAAKKIKDIHEYCEQQLISLKNHTFCIHGLPTRIKRTELHEQLSELRVSQAFIKQAQTEDKLNEVFKKVEVFSTNIKPLQIEEEYEKVKQKIPSSRVEINKLRPSSAQQGGEEKKVEKTPVNMCVLGGFIAALGAAAVALAFLALNAAGLAVSGVMLAAAGVGTIAFGGCKIYEGYALFKAADHVGESASQETQPQQQITEDSVNIASIGT